MYHYHMINLIENTTTVVLNLHNLQCHNLQKTSKKNNQADLEDENAGLKKISRVEKKRIRIIG